MVTVQYAFTVCCVLGVLFGIASPSAIPMWEYLTQDEKVSITYLNVYRQEFKLHSILS